LSQKHLAISATVTVITVMIMSGLVAVASWFGLERLIYFRHRQNVFAYVKSTWNTYARKDKADAAIPDQVAMNPISAVRAPDPTQEGTRKEHRTRRMRELLPRMIALQHLRTHQRPGTQILDHEAIFNAPIPSDNASVDTVQPEAHTDYLQIEPKVDLKSLKAITEAVAHRARIKHVKFSPDGELLATSSEDRTTVIFDVKVRILPSCLDFKH
jgi:hypothetical protein